MPIYSYVDLAVEVSESSPRVADTRIVAIDGRSGSGKTRFSCRLARALESIGASVSLIHADDLYNGWQHPTAFAPRLDEWVVTPLLHGRRARYRRYDWSAWRFQSEWIDVGAPDVLIIEGVSTASARWRPLLTYSVMMIAHGALSFQRAVSRDGDAIIGPLRKFVAQAETHFAADATERHVDLLVDGDPCEPHDPQQEFISLSR